MNKTYNTAALEELRDQLVRYIPKDKKLAQMDRAEELFREIRDDIGYSYKYIYIRITEFPSEVFEDVTLNAADVRADLLLLIEDLSDSVDIADDEMPEKVWTIDELCRHFNVASKTISRWRRTMLSGRKFLFDGKRRVGFLDTSVDWFVKNYANRIERSSRFSKLTESEKLQFVQKGRELAALGITPTEVARRLSENSGRSVETIRYTLKTFDTRNADIPLFASRTEPLREETKNQIFRSYRRGESIRSIAFRFNRTVGSIYRIVGQMRAERIRQLPIAYIDSPEFDMIRSGNEDKRVCGPKPPAVLDDPNEKPKRHVRIPEGLPPYLARLYDVPLLTPEQELHLFRKLNYLKYKASVLRNSLNVDHPSSLAMRQVEQYYDEAVETKNEIVSANLRLVVSIAKRHIGAKNNLFELISDGNISLIRAVEKFDYTRGNRFSTYATWAIMRNFARTIPDEQRYHERFLSTDSDIFEMAVDERSDVFFEERVQHERENQVNRFLSELDDREQKIIVSRFGLGRTEQPQTLREVGDEMGVTKERIRQIENRALAKLRKAAEGERLDIPGLPR